MADFGNSDAGLRFNDPFPNNGSTFGPVYGQQQQTNPYVVKPATPLPATKTKAKSQNPFVLDPVMLKKKNPFLIPLVPNADLFGLNIPS